MKITILMVMMITLAVSSRAWSESTDFNHQEKDVIDSVKTDPLFSQSHLNLSIKNYLKTLKEEDSGVKRTHNAWGQGFGLDFKSGYYSDVIGFDATFNSAVKLGASDWFNSRGVLYNKGSGNKKSNASGYTKFSERNIKLKYDVNNVNLNARWGWQTVKNLGVLNNSTRLSATTYQGVTGAASYDDFTLRGAYVNRSMDRNSADKKRFQTNAGKYIDHLTSGELAWKSDALDVQYSYGESKNYLRRNILQANVKPLASLNVGAQVYGTHALEDYKSMPAGRRDFDNDAWHFTVDAKWRAEKWSSRWGLGYTQAKKAHAVGFFPRHMSRHSRGTFTSMAFAGSDYMRDGELMLSTISDYNLTPELALGVTASIAQFNYRGNHVRTGEINAFSRWVPTDPALKNLTLWVMFGPGWSYNMQMKTPVLTDGYYSQTTSFSTEMIIEYKFNLF